MKKLNEMFLDLQSKGSDPRDDVTYLLAVIKCIAEGDWRYPEGPMSLAQNVLDDVMPY